MVTIAFRLRDDFPLQLKLGNTGSPCAIADLLPAALDPRPIAGPWVYWFLFQPGALESRLFASDGRDEFMVDAKIGGPRLLMERVFEVVPRWRHEPGKLIPRRTRFGESHPEVLVIHDCATGIAIVDDYKATRAAMQSNVAAWRNAAAAELASAEAHLDHSALISPTRHYLPCL